jgi:hypothetical protein
MIYICYGITKTASSFVFQLTEAILRAAGRKPWRVGWPLFSPDNYFGQIDPELLRDLRLRLGQRDLVVKTHGHLHPEIARQIAAGEVLACASIRDPREIALSMLDHGRRNRGNGRRSFTEFHAPLDTLPSLDDQIASFRAWSSIENVLLLQYNEICFTTGDVVERIARQIDVPVNTVEIVNLFSRKSKILQFNLGIPARYLAMSEGEQEVFLERYADLYADYDFENVLRGLREKARALVERPS